MIELLELALPPTGFRAILADPPWRFRTWNMTNQAKSASRYYDLMETEEIAGLPVQKIVADDAVLFMWASWPMLEHALRTMKAWGFTYKTVAFDWMKANAKQIDMFREDTDPTIGLGYWTRANSEPCLLGIRGKPKRLSKGVRMGIIEPRREHSRKPDCVYDRIEKLVDGPYLEMFARHRREGWSAWGNQLDHTKDFDWLGPDERTRFHVLREGRVDAHPGPLFPQ